MNDKMVLWPSSAFVSINGVLYFPHGKVNAFFRYSLDEDKTSLLGPLDEKSSFFNWPLYSRIVSLGRYLYIAPYYADSIIIYDINKNAIDTISCSSFFSSDEGKMVNAFIRNNDIIFVPLKKNSPWIKMNRNSRTIEKDSSISFDYPEKIELLNYTNVVNDTMIGSYVDSDTMFAYRISTNEFRFIYTRELRNRIVDSCLYDGDRVFVYCRGDSEVYIFDSENWECIDIVEINNQHAHIIAAYSGSLFIETYNPLCICMYNTHTKEVVYSYPCNDDNEKNEFSYSDETGIVIEYNGSFWYFNRHTGVITDIYNGLSRKIRIPKGCENEIKEIVSRQKMNQKSFPLRETDTWDIRNLIDYGLLKKTYI